ncbi:protein kinase domain-containing protein [Halomonas sp.]|uniref:protein kinase domain-containing protein n=1 Tax=Halomonas sp. TaxID=1486246 RepID=UPI00298DB3E9|nr:protein kinase [Halomonas sp.]MDW7746678.1 protein kinase [Halomonas sp.]
MSWNEHTQGLLETEVFKGRVVERRKGRGGLVYIVEQDAIPNRIAYKTIQEFESNLFVDTERLDREARNWFGFSGHPLVIKPHFIEVWNNVPLICMPYCDGDLSNLVGKELSLAGVVCLSLQIVKGMITANERGMDHHQDVKPENLLYIDLSAKFRDFPPSGVDAAVRYSVRIADFGVANAWRDNHLGGTNAYKAPEQHDANAYDTFAPDVFAVGLVIAELFQGYHPAAKDPGTKVWNWKGSKLKKWTIGGERHFSPTHNAQAQELVQLVKKMLTANPGERPSFQQCYARLASILECLSPKTFKQLELLFEYFEYLANYCAMEREIEGQLKLAVLPSQREMVKESIKQNLKDSLGGGVTSLERALRVHHLAKALHRVCGKNCIDNDKELLVEGSISVLRFTLKNHEIITSDCLWPLFSFGNPEPKKFVSDIEAKAEILNTNIERLQILSAYDVQLEVQVDESGKVIRACRILNEASDMWRRGHRAEACDLLGEVRRLAPYEPELESLYERWNSTRDLFAESNSRDKHMTGRITK